MSIDRKKLLLVGDNPFHGISHLSEDRVRVRGDEINRSDYAAKLIQASLENGADGFMFSVSETTLSALRILSENVGERSPKLYAIVPYAYEYVRLATNIGTIGLAKQLAKEIMLSGNTRAIAAGLKCIATMDPKDILKAYLLYELSRIKSAITTKFALDSVMLHEVITEMVLSLDLDWLAKYYIGYALSLGIKPGFETRNFAYLVNKFQDWGIDFREITIATAFNSVGFQMNPSKNRCEEALARIPGCNVIAMSILAAGYIALPEAAEYIKSLPNIKGMVVGISKEKHAFETFSFLREEFPKQNQL